MDAKHYAKLVAELHCACGGDEDPRHIAGRYAFDEARWRSGLALLRDEAGCSEEEWKKVMAEAWWSTLEPEDRRSPLWRGFKLLIAGTLSLPAECGGTIHE